jgi:hypothetical protein
MLERNETNADSKDGSRFEIKRKKRVESNNVSEHDVLRRLCSKSKGYDRQEQ